MTVTAPPAAALEIFGWTLFGEEEADETADTAPIPAADPTPYTVDITLSGGDDDLEQALTDASNLITLQDVPPDGTAGLIHRGRSDLERLVAVLSANARFGGQLSIKAAGVPVNAQDAFVRIDRARGRGPIPVTIAVDAGPVFKFGSVVLENAAGGPWQGPPLDDALAGLVPGEPALPSVVLETERKIVAELRDQGYALAAIPRRRAVVNHSTRLMRVTYFIDSGDQLVFGPVAVSGTEQMDPEFVRERANIMQGDRYSPEEVRKARRRVNDLGAFRSVRVREAEEANPDGSLSTTIEVEERKRRFIGFRAGVSNTDGAWLGAYWGHRNLFGHADTLRVEAEVSRLGQNGLKDTEGKVGVTFRRPGALTAQDDLTVAVVAARERPEAYDRDGITALISLERRLNEHLVVSGGISGEYSKVLDVTGRNEFGLIGAPLWARYDSTDNELDPTEGIRALISLEPVASVSGTGSSFVQAEASASAYKAIDDARRFILAGRVAIGSISGADLAQVPANRRFFAGGGGSIRGYAYQSASPRNALGQIIGGRSLFEANLELRARVTETVGIVPFIDVGGAYTSSLPNFNDIYVGAGIGLRYHTSIGPLRLDVAYPFTETPENDWPVAVYVSLGQAF